MQEIIKDAGNWVVWIAGVCAAIGAMWQLIAKPLRKLDGKVDTAIKLSQDALDDTGDLLGDRLEQAHDYYVAHGYCPQGKKKQLSAMFKRYKEMGRNHLAEHYEEDLLALPEVKP